MANHVFKETQKFNQPWIWVILLGTHLSVHIWGVRDLVNEYSKGNDWWTSETFIAGLIGLVLLNLLLVMFLRLKLETRIDRAGIQFRYPPIINSWRKIPLKEIQSAQVIKYLPWTYGGWGIKYSLHGWAYNVRGNKGIIIKKKNGKQLLIGTQRNQEAQEAINQLLREEREINYGQ
jgi:hypothetical protein